MGYALNGGGGGWGGGGGGGGLLIMLCSRGNGGWGRERVGRMFTSEGCIVANSWSI